MRLNWVTLQTRQTKTRSPNAIIFPSVLENLLSLFVVWFHSHNLNWMELTVIPQPQLHPKCLPSLCLKSRVCVFHTTPNPTSPPLQASIYSLNPRILTPFIPPRNISTAALTGGDKTSTFPIDSGLSSFSSPLPLLRFCSFSNESWLLFFFNYNF